MASLYQRFTGKINTTNSFPHPPEASHLLGGQVADEENAAKTPQQLVDGRPHVQYRKKCLREDEDVRHLCFIYQHAPTPPPLHPMTNLHMCSVGDPQSEIQTLILLHTHTLTGLHSTSLQMQLSSLVSLLQTVQESFQMCFLILRFEF